MFRFGATGRDLFGVFLNGPSPFSDLTQKIREIQTEQDTTPTEVGGFTDKKTYGVPQSLSALVLYYRKDLFENLKSNQEI